MKPCLPTHTLALALVVAGMAVFLGCNPAPLTGAGGSSSDAARNAALDPEWTALAELARKEGTVVVKGGVSDEIRSQISPLFSRRFGVEVEYTGSSSSEFAVQTERERAAGLYATDVVITGAAVFYPVIHPNGWLDPLLPQLTHPEALDASQWPGGKLWFDDPEGMYILRLGRSVTPMLYVNTSVVKPGDIQSWFDLLKPEYQGKIATQDPDAQGSGHLIATMIYLKLGEDFFKRLYIDQKPTVIRDARQLGDALARGTHPIVLGLGAENFELVRQEGFPVDIILSLPEIPAMAGGQPQIGLMKNAPHPNAAKLFLNWAASREGMEFLTRTAKNVPVRLDANKSGLAPYLIPEPDREYLDTYEWDFAVNTRLALSPKVRALLH